jgi:hypothetical protein
MLLLHLRISAQQECVLLNKCSDMYRGSRARDMGHQLTRYTASISMSTNEGPIAVLTVFERLIGRFKQPSLRRIHAFGLHRAEVEEGSIERSKILAEEVSMTGVGLENEESDLGR